MDKNLALLRLFNAVGVTGTGKLKWAPSPVQVHNMVRNGFILHPSVRVTANLLSIVEKVIGISGEKANSSFRKSWSIIQDSSIGELVAHQILHYITTYGFEALGVYDENTVYIPADKLELPELTEGLTLTVVHGLTDEQILVKVNNLASSGIALHQDTLDDIMTIITNSKFQFSDFNCYNRELRSLLMDFYNIVPTEPVEYLRYLVSKLTGESLLIKNGMLITKLKESNQKFLDTLLVDAPDDLASIFFRFKPLFLAMKTVSNNKTFFNHLRKKANRLHKPMVPDYLGTVTSQLKNGSLDLNDLVRHLSKSSIWKKIRLAYALNYRLRFPSSIVYKIRNGKGWADKFDWRISNFETGIVFDRVCESIVRDIGHLDGETIYIPKNIHYTLPATEKQLTGNLPNGTFVTVPEDLIVGVHWWNTDERRVDLDLSVLSDSGKIGWNASYTSTNKDVLFSGDMTDAPKPNGATELFYIKKQSNENYLLMVNDYNYVPNSPVPTKIIVASEKASSFRKNYMVDVNNLIATANIKIDKKSSILGLVSGNKVYFSHSSVGTGIVSSCDDASRHAREYLINSVKNSIELSNMLSLAGANVVNDKDGLEDFIDLSPESLDKNTIISLLNGSIKTKGVLV